MEKDNKEKTEKPRFTKEKLIEGLKNGTFKNITFMTGAGISVAAGIPDFRSPDTGLYANLKEYDLPSPEAIFDIDFFQEKPEAFYKLAKDFLDMSKYKATYVHHFCKMVQDKKLVNYYLTQNIDNLEEQAGFEQKDMIQAHGANFGAVCSKCDTQQDKEKLKTHITSGEVMYCSQDGCEGPVKPEITFFGEGLPEKFMTAFGDQFGANTGSKTDLLIVIGTSLAVGPFNMTVNIVGDCPKVLINMENTADSGFDFDDAENYPERILLKGRAQTTVQEISEACGWKEELLQRKKDADAKHDAAKVDDLADQMAGLNVQTNKEEGQITENAGKDEEEKKSEDTQATSQIVDSEKGEKEEKDSSSRFITEAKKIDPKNEPEEGPIMGFFAVEPKKECPHCIPGDNIAPKEDFEKDGITVKSPCKDCSHTQENWVCLKCKAIGCSRYVNCHMVAHNDAEKHPIALSFADFSFWCYECDSYVISKHLDHVKYFYPQKFGTESASHVKEYEGILASKARKDPEDQSKN